MKKIDNKKRKKLDSSHLALANLHFANNGEEKYVRMHVSRIAAKIKELRVGLNVSQEELAEMTLVSVSTIKSIEQNQRSPSLPMLIKILYYLDQHPKSKKRDCLI